MKQHFDPELSEEFFGRLERRADITPSPWRIVPFHIGLNHVDVHCNPILVRVYDI